MRELVRAIVIGSVLAAPAASQGQSAEPSETDYVRVTGTRVRIAPPAGFTRARDFLGFALFSRIARIGVDVLPHSVASAIQASSDEALAAAGITVLSREQVRVDSFPGELIGVRHQAKVGTLRSWTLLFGNDVRHVRISSSYLERERAEFAEPLRRALLGARWAPDAPLDPFEGLSFVVRGESRFELAQRTFDRVTFTKDGVLPPKQPGDPAVVVLQAKLSIPEEEQAAYCTAQLDEAQDFPDLKVTHSNPVEVGGLPGCEAIGHAVFEGERLLVYQAALFSRRKVYVFKARVGWASYKVWLPEMRGMVSRFRLR